MARRARRGDRPSPGRGATGHDHYRTIGRAPIERPHRDRRVRPPAARAGYGCRGAAPRPRGGARGRLLTVGRVRGKASVPSRHLEAFLEMLVAERGAAQLTREAYARDLAHATAHLATHGRTLEKAQIEDLRGYVAALGRAEVSPRTLARKLSALRQFYRFLVVDGVRRAPGSAACWSCSMPRGCGSPSWFGCRLRPRNRTRAC